MAFQDLYFELRGAVPRLPIAYAKTLVNRAWKDVRQKSLWSFQLYESAWMSPPSVTAGTATTVQGSTSVTLDATATAALNASITSALPAVGRQFRLGGKSLYSIISWNVTGTLVLDRIFSEQSATGAGYQIYQCYYAAPTPDFRSFISVRDMQNFISLNLTKTREEVDMEDPMRSYYSFPGYVIPYQTDSRAGSPTLGSMLYELWGQPNFAYTWQVLSIRDGADLSLPTDTLPLVVGEDLIMARARVLGYEWAESNKDPAVPRSNAADYKFLMGAASAEYTKLLQTYRKNDRARVDNFLTRCGVAPSALSRTTRAYSTLSGYATP